MARHASPVRLVFAVSIAPGVTFGIATLSEFIPGLVKPSAFGQVGLSDSQRYVLFLSDHVSGHYALFPGALLFPGVALFPRAGIADEMDISDDPRFGVQVGDILGG